MVNKCAEYKVGDKIIYTETVTGEGVVTYVPSFSDFDYVNVRLSDGTFVNFDFGDKCMINESKNAHRKIDVNSLKKVAPSVTLGDVYSVEVSKESNRKYVAMQDPNGPLWFIRLSNMMDRFYEDEFFIRYPDAVKSSL
jgi:hypothetical protein